MQKEYKLFKKQREFFNSTSPITALICGRGFGKSHVASLYIAINFLRGLRIIALAQTFKALHEVLFAEILARLDEMDIPYRFEKQNMKITYGDGVIYGASYENIESVRGLSQISIAVCDEAALSPSNLFSVLAPCLRGEGIDPYIRLLSTPRRGSWLNLYIKEHPESVEVIHAKTTDNPLITEEQIKLMKQSIVNDEMLQQELEGIMLDIDSESSVIQLKDYPTYDSGHRGELFYMGIDLSGLGSDSNVLTVASRYRVEEQKSIRVADTFELTNEAENLVHKWNVKAVYIDITGSTSCGLLDMLKAKGVNAVGINFAQKPFSDRFANARAEMYVELSTAIKSGMYIESDDIKTQLSYTTLDVNASGKFQLVKKDRIKELIGHSPDESDSLALAIYAMNHGGGIVDEARHAKEVASRYLSMFSRYNDL